jgi:DNA-binding response OmpR family regulator
MASAKQLIEVLLIEDDLDVARTVQEGLEPCGFTVTHAPDLVSSERHLERRRFAALILDLTLPDGDGLALAAGLRARGDETPILILTARDSVPDRLVGFDHGADDYLGKPFDVNELAARLRVIVRRTGRSTRHLLRYADLELNLLTRIARRPDLEATLSDREAELLSYMMRRPDEVLERERLLDELWGDEVDETSNLVNVYINLLRNKVESPSHIRLIHTVRGVGYKLSRSDPHESV